MAFLSLQNLNLHNKVVLLRADLNVPMKGEKVTNDFRIQSLLPTLEYLLKKEAKIVIVSHLGRPRGHDLAFSLHPVAEALQQALPQIKVSFCPHTIGPSRSAMIHNLKPGQILLLENLRFYPEEEKNMPSFAQALAQDMDLYVNDAFACSHRAHASIDAITHYLAAYPGLLLEKEISNLTHILTAPQKPLMALIGGAKISNKITLLMSLLSRCETIAIVGGMASAFIKARGFSVGRSLLPHGSAELAKQILDKSTHTHCHILLPEDVVVTKEIRPESIWKVVSCDEIAPEDIIVDIGPRTVSRIVQAIDAAKTLLWNGSAGITEITPFDKGTTALGSHIAARTQSHNLISIAGGGDTVAALALSGDLDNFTYISTGGGTFLEWVEGKTLPGLRALAIATPPSPLTK